MGNVIRRRVVVAFHVGRSGSRVLGELLDQHSRICWDGEIARKLIERRDLSYETPQVLCERLKEHLRKQVDSAEKPIYGFEIKAQHLKWVGLTEREFLEFMDRTYPVEYVVLRRENLLRKILSSRIAGDRKMYHVKRTPTSPTSVLIPPDEAKLDGERTTLIAALDRCAAFFEELSRLLEHRAHLRLTYEGDIQADPKRACQRVVEFLGLSVEPVTVGLAVTNPFTIRQMLENFDEVERALQGTPYHWMLEQDR